MSVALPATAAVGQDLPAIGPEHAAQQRADASGAAQRQLLAELSHDLRTPLTSVRLLVKALRDDLVGEDRRQEYLARIELEVLLLSELVDDLHSAAREQVADRDTRAHCVEPAGIVEAAVETMRIQADVKGVRLEREVAPHLPTVRGNPSQLHRVLLNLIENAIRHTREGGRVVVRAERTLRSVELEVEDDGDGIPRAERSRVFAAFHGSDGQRARGRSGLGLAIARAAVEAHGGRIWLAESPQGTRVRLSLPAPAEQRRARGGCHEPARNF